MNVYQPETANGLYADLQEAYRMLPDYRRAYSALNRTFQLCLSENTNFSGIRFGGAFAKADYLLKEHQASRHLLRSVNDARVRLRQLSSLANHELQENFLYDLKAVCQFVALVYSTPVPGVLEAVFPKERTEKRGELKADSLRVIVNRWDDTFLYAFADVEGTDELKIFYGGKSETAVYKDWDWSYLQTLLKEGCQLNVVRPREKEGVLYPELIIWEPDYLVDISAIAACFEDYGVSPLNHLLNKLKPAPSTQPIVLGNLAGQFLDEGLYLYPNDCSYKESVQRFFKDNAIPLLTTELSADFHLQAQQQKKNIHHILREKLPELLPDSRFDSTEVMVEPSFFSEMLGLQGRMDFLQLDQKIVIEQKSGKGGYPESDPPRMQQKHYVQLLLYMLLLRYNYRQKYEENHHKLFAFLLYSRYPNGLLPLGFAPELVFAAIKLRNEIAAAEYDYTRGSLDVLSMLTADSLNEQNVHSPLWERYQKPQIDQLLSPIHEASKLERAYYLRFLQFLATEHLMAKVGNQSKENSGFADKWYSSLEDKLLAGNIYCDLQLLSPAKGETGRVAQVEMGFTERPDLEISNFRTGDIVIFYPYKDGEEPDARRTMVFRATIEDIGTEKILLNLRSAQTDAHVFWYNGDRKWAVEHDFFDSSFSSLYRGMHAFLSAPKQRRDLLLLQREPEIDNSQTLVGDYGSFNELALRVKQAQDLYLIIGPPGTGKTSYGLLYTLKEALLSSQDSVLLLSYTNRAVDEICSKLIESDIDFIRIGGRFSCEENCKPYLLDTKAEQCERISDLKAIVCSTRVFVGTTTAFNAQLNLFRLKQFSLAIIDEASQILEPHLVGLLSATDSHGACAIKKIVLIGDHKQLPAVVQQKEEESAVDNPLLKSIHLDNCRYSLFERLLRCYGKNPQFTYMLTRQGRMHHDIAQFPNDVFYQNRLQEVPLHHQQTQLPKRGKGKNGIDDMLTTRRLSFVAVSPTSQRTSDKVNANEAQAIAATVIHIYHQCKENFSALQTVGIIVPYRNQISEIRRCIDAYGIPVLHDITIDTVERYQGSQRDYILYGFTVQKHYQLAFLTSNVFEEEGCVIDRKLNVAMTRARKHLLLFGNPVILDENVVFRQLMEYVRSQDSFFDVPLADYIEGRFMVPSL